MYYILQQQNDVYITIQIQPMQIGHKQEWVLKKKPIISQIAVQFSNLWPFLTFSIRRPMISLTHALTLTLILPNKSAIDLSIWKGCRFENILKWDRVYPIYIYILQWWKYTLFYELYHINIMDFIKTYKIIWIYLCRYWRCLKSFTGNYVGFVILENIEPWIIFVTVQGEWLKFKFKISSWLLFKISVFICKQVNILLYKFYVCLSFILDSEATS
jgi:hypothetical protein